MKPTLKRLLYESIILAVVLSVISCRSPSPNEHTAIPWRQAILEDTTYSEEDRWFLEQELVSTLHRWHSLGLHPDTVDPARMSALVKKDLAVVDAWVQKGEQEDERFTIMKETEGSFLGEIKTGTCPDRGMFITWMLVYLGEDYPQYKPQVDLILTDWGEIDGAFHTKQRSELNFRDWKY